AGSRSARSKPNGTWTTPISVRPRAARSGAVAVKRIWAGVGACGMALRTRSRVSETRVSRFATRTSTRSIRSPCSRTLVSTLSNRVSTSTFCFAKRSSVQSTVAHPAPKRARAAMRTPSRVPCIMGLPPTAATLPPRAQDPKVFVRTRASRPLACATPGEHADDRPICEMPHDRHHQSIETLKAEFAKAKKPPVKVRLAPGNLEDEDLLEIVNAGLVKMTIVEDCQFLEAALPPAQRELQREGPHRCGPRVDDPQGQSGQRTDIWARYLKSTRWAKGATSAEDLKRFEEARCRRSSAHAGR